MLGPAESPIRHVANYLPKVVPVLTPELSQGLKQHYEDGLLEIIQRNRFSRYGTESPSLLAFRDSLDEPSGTLDSSAAEVTLETFRTTVPFSDYAMYEPFVRKLFEVPCKKEEVENLLSTGYPSFIAISSSTTGKSMKYFPKYAFPHPDPLEGSVQATSIFNCLVMHLWTKRTFDVREESGQLITQFPLCSISAGLTRAMFNMKVDQDQAVMAVKVPTITSPLGVSFINNYRSFIVMHALFALQERRAETLYTPFGTTLIDFITFMDEEWDKLLAAIETGILPDFEGAEHVHSYLQSYFFANPERVAELRSIETMKGSSGWLKKIWPNFKEYTGIVSGPFSGALSKVQWYLGPDVRLRSPGYILSECWPGLPYSGLNLYKLARDEYYEFLPASQVEISDEETTACLIPPWQVETGKMYEPVVTSRDGLWRYRLGDLIRMEGFDSNDGSPIMSFVERRHAEIRMMEAAVPEAVIVNAIFSTTEKTIGRVVDFTSYLDSRAKLPTIGYVVELDGDIGPNPSLARQEVLAVLKAQHELVQHKINANNMGLPTIRIVERGTFAEFRHWRVESAGISFMQVKVPAILKDETQLERLLKRVVHEA
ncbi:GH3 auxin-responsive promoter [Melanogaster broomeanus]|nr:GH3 auxin-responsive promoter [Melanogaster broomeanus]